LSFTRNGQHDPVPFNIVKVKYDRLLGVQKERKREKDRNKKDYSFFHDIYYSMILWQRQGTLMHLLLANVIEMRGITNGGEGGFSAA
jgi:hypothetical protein